MVALAAGGSHVPLLAQQALDTGAGLVAVSHSTAVQDLQLALYAEASRRGWASGEVRLPRIVAGPDAAREVATVPCDVVLNGITGAAGLTATLATLATGPDPGAGQQGVAGDRRPAGGQPAAAPARWWRWTPSTPRWPSACGAASGVRSTGWC